MSKKSLSRKDEGVQSNRPYQTRKKQGKQDLGAAKNLKILPKDVAQRIQSLLDSRQGTLRPANFTKKIVDKLSNLESSSAHHVVDLMINRDWAKTKNVSSCIGNFIKDAQDLAT
ncbi:hypothetical protein WJX75_001996 [Coccomyxa subellipsoidea]|uniref:Uncharacterized protein n=1 Tax=Coccomyxa subellipsoidea TaxID=248742 RepID=A0ABR2Z2N0_9CHLO